MKLDGKVALVTGGNRGIGKAMGTTFAEEGAKVVLTARRAAIGEPVAQDLRSAGHDVTFIAADVTDENEVRTLIDSVISRHGALDIVVNNAGIAPASPVESMDTAVWHELIACNVTSMFLVTKHAIPHLRETRGNIINLGSTFGVVGRSEEHTSELQSH